MTCSCGGLQKYAEGGRTRVPKTGTRFLNPEAETNRGRAGLAALQGYFGAERPSAMYPGASEAYDRGELASLLEAAIPGAGLAKGALGTALAGVIKPRGGNWLTGSVENALRGIKKPELSTAMDMYGNVVPNALAHSPTAISNSALNKWIEGPLTKYIKRDMATPNDPVMALAEQNILHYVPGREFYRPDINIDRVRQRAGFPAEGIGKSDLARKWENVSDEMIVLADVAKLRLRNALPDEGWINKLSDDSKMYSTLEPGYFKDSTGFGHLVDELSNSLNPDSGLPRNLLLRPEQMQQMGMERAVRHVDAINKWRAAQQAAANAELANKARVIREYTENNPKGLRWVELRAPEGTNTAYVGAGKYEDPAANELAKQLKYEGDTMGHCVGGYCEDVIGGYSRIFSLRDAKGEPHVTIEVNPDKAGLMDLESFYETMSRNDPQWAEKYPRPLKPMTDPQGKLDWEKFESQMNTPEFKNFKGANSATLTQIKGKQNLAPKDEYLPFVRDFVKNPPENFRWSEYYDLDNAGLYPRDWLLETPYQSILEKSPEKFFTQDDIKSILGTEDIDWDAISPWKPEYAEGGLVDGRGYFDNLDAFLRR